MRKKYNYGLEKIAKYTFFERLKYTWNNNLFCKKKYLWLFMLPYIASNRDIHINNIWKDTTKKQNKKA